MNVFAHSPSLDFVMDKLIMQDLEECSQEVFRQIVNHNFNPSIRGPLSNWRVNDLVEWVQQIDLGDEEMTNYAAKVLKCECVDGYTFSNMTDAVWVQELNLDQSLLCIMKSILQGWEIIKDGSLEELARSIGDYCTSMNVPQPVLSNPIVYRCTMRNGHRSKPLRC